MNPRRIELSVLERAELVRRATRVRAGVEARRARVILLLAGGATWDEVENRLHCSRGFIARWAARFRESRLSGFYPHYHGQQARLPSSLEARVARAAAQRRRDGRPRWTTRTLGGHLGISHMTVHRIWQKRALWTRP